MTFDSSGIVLTRQQLYDRVWSKAMYLLAKEYGLSDQGLAKTCKRYQIPVPPRGYWAKKAAGKKQKQAPLPPCSDPVLQTITFTKAAMQDAAEPVAEPKPAPIYDPDVLDLLNKARSLPDEIVPEQLRDPHPLVRDYLNEDKRGRGVLNIRVYKGSQARAARIMDGFIKTVESLGGRVAVEKKSGQRHITVLYLLGRKITALYLRERWRMQLRDPKERDFSWHHYNDLPTGLLVLEMDRFDTGFMTSYLLCRDTPKTRMEERLKALLIRFIEQVGKDRIQERIDEEEMRKREAGERIRREREAEIERQRQILIQKQKEEQARLNGLMKQATSWHESRILRAYIRAVREEGIRRHGRIDYGSELDHWLTWASAQADRLDPLVMRRPPSILDQKA